MKYNDDYPNNDIKCDSEYWWNEIKATAEVFTERMNKKWVKSPFFIELDTEKLSDALNIYKKGWWEFKEHTYEKNAKVEVIDRHKIIALYILAFLIKEPFQLRGNKDSEENLDEDNRPVFLANEVFSFIMLQALLRGWNGKDDAIFKMRGNKRKWFLILLNHLKLKFAESKPSFIATDQQGTVNLLSLAQTIFYIEKCFYPQAST